MKAIVHDRYGPPDVLVPLEVPKPEPKDNEIRVRLHATSVTSGDARLRAFRVPPLFWLPARLGLGVFGPRNRILGSEFAGDIDAVGRNVTRWKPGDAVFGFRVFGAYAEYLCLPADGVVAPKPPNLTYAEAAALPFGGLTALHFLRKAGIAPGMKVLVNGASGGVGTAAVQIARHLGATVTAVCSGANRDLVVALGAARVIDYTQEDFTRSGEVYDIILDCVGTTSFGRCRGSLGPTGVHVFLVTGLVPLLQSLWTPLTGGRRVICGVAPERPEDLADIRALAETGALKPVIDRRYPFEQTAEAHAYADTGRKRGSVVISLENFPGG